MEGIKDMEANLASHDPNHVERVKKLAILIAEREGADLKIIEKAAELHDIARNRENHAAEGAKLAKKLLISEGFERDFAEKVADCIESHSFSSGKVPESLEGWILSDADKLDAMGAIGVARAFFYSREQNKGIEEAIKHFEEKLLKLYDVLHTETAKQIGLGRHRFLEEFYNRIKREMELEDFEI
jgi:uncharacterized protein